MCIGTKDNARHASWPCDEPHHAVHFLPEKHSEPLCYCNMKMPILIKTAATAPSKITSLAEALFFTSSQLLLKFLRPACGYFQVLSQNKDTDWFLNTKTDQSDYFTVSGLISIRARAIRDTDNSGLSVSCGEL